MDQINNIFTWTIPEIIKYLKQAPISELENLLKDNKKINSLPQHIFNIFALNVPIEIKRQLFDDPNYFNKIKKIEKNRFNKTYFELLSEQEKIEYLKHLKQEEISTYIPMLNKEELKHLEKLNLSVDQLLKELQTKWNLEPNIIQEIKNKISQKQRNITYYTKANNINELIIYHKFNLMIQIKEYDQDKNQICLNDQTVLSMDYINKIYLKHLNIIIDKMKEISPNEKDQTKIFLSSLRLYEIFGFDNAIKILNQKFTYMTLASYKKYAEIKFVEIRRQYRIHNQEKFYSYELLQKIKQSLRENNLYYLENICKNSDPEYLKTFSEALKNKSDEVISEMLQKEIKEREENLKNSFINQYINSTDNKKRPSLTCDEIYKQIKDVVYTPILNAKGQVEKNLELTKFLLGNEKHDNDCLFRLMMNQKAFGLNQNFSRIINSFNTIKKITKRKNNSLSMYSILDIIDICKSIIYKLAPNEKDMPLDAISKILSSSQFCSEPSQLILKRAKKLHIERKKKYSSYIPTTSGMTNDKIRYQVLNFNYERLITTGIDTGSCLRVGGKGEDFLKYCMTNKHAVIIGLWDLENRFYICPFIRNGNGIYGNGIDPKPETREEMENLLEALKICTKQIINKSVKSEKIEFACITDLNNEEFFKYSGLPKLTIDRYIPLDEQFYSDYHKKERTTYIISNTPNYKKPTYYYPKHEYLQNRTRNYIYDQNTEKDKKEIEQLINAIKYEHIELRSKVSKKYKAKRSFIPMNIDDYKYIIGNKDWLIAIDYYNTIESYCIPYDPRARIEYKNALINLENRYNIHLEGKTL